MRGARLIQSKRGCLRNWLGVTAPNRASDRVTEAMSATTAKREEDTDELSDCEHDWCPGPTGETLPCFECFDPNREDTQSSVVDAKVTDDAEATA